MVAFQCRHILVAVASISKGGRCRMMRSVSSGRRKTSFVAIAAAHLRLVVVLDKHDAVAFRSECHSESQRCGRGGFDVGAWGDQGSQARWILDNMTIAMMCTPGQSPCSSATL